MRIHIQTRPSLRLTESNNRDNNSSSRLNQEINSTPCCLALTSSCSYRNPRPHSYRKAKRTNKPDQSNVKREGAFHTMQHNKDHAASTRICAYINAITERTPVKQSVFDTVHSQATNPQPSLTQFIHLAREYSITDISTMSMAIVYVHRVLRFGQVRLTTQNVVYVFATALCIASKFAEDQPFNNLTFAYLCNLPLPLFNQLEIHMLALLRFRLTIDPERLTALHDAFHLETV